MDVVTLSYDPGPWWYYVPVLKDVVLWLKTYSLDFLSFNNGTLLILGAVIVFAVLYWMQILTDWDSFYYLPLLRWIGFFLIVLSVFLHFCGVISLNVTVLLIVVCSFPIFMYIITMSQI